MSVITSTGNAAVKRARRLVRRRGRARGDEEFLVEGPEVVAEALPFLRRLFVADRPPGAGGEAEGIAAVAAAARDAGVEVLAVSEQVLATLASTVTPQGLVGVAALPPTSPSVAVDGATLVVVGHQIRDPGNLGSVLRSADAAGADAVVLTRGSVDPRNGKAVRASAGSLFHLPVVAGVAFADVAGACRERRLRLVAATSDGPTVYTEARLSAPTALVFGNEAHGLPPAVVAGCDDVVRVPLQRRERPGYAGCAESLNLAATVAVVVYEAARQRGFFSRERHGRR